MDSYRKRMFSKGNTRREQAINRKRDSIYRYAIDNPSYKIVEVNGQTTELVIDSTDSNDIKSFKAMEPLDRGAIIKWNGLWLVKDTDYDDEVYQKGTIKKCNYVLKWINSDRDIIQRDCVVSFPYYSSLTSNKVIQVNNTRCIIDVPFDGETNKIVMGDRFFVTRNPDNPVVYEVENVNDVANVFSGKGYITLSLKESQLNVNEDNTELLICNYKEKKEEPVVDDKEHTIKLTSKPVSLVIGYESGTNVTASFYDNDTKNEDMVAKWEVLCDFKDKLTIKEVSPNKLNIKTEWNALKGRSFTVKAIDENGVYKTGEIVLQVKGM